MSVATASISCNGTVVASLESQVAAPVSARTAQVAVKDLQVWRRMANKSTHTRAHAHTHTQAKVGEAFDKLIRESKESADAGDADGEELGDDGFESDEAENPAKKQRTK